MKASMSLAVVFGLVFLQLALHRDLRVLILIDCFLFGVCGMASYPVGLECAAEVAFPVSETTSTGLIVLSGQIQSVLYVMLMKSLASPLAEIYHEFQVCSAAGAEVSASDMTIPVVAMSIVAGLLVVVLIAFFHPTYRRMAAERKPEPTVDISMENGITKAEIRTTKNELTTGDAKEADRLIVERQKGMES